MKVFNHFTEYKHSSVWERKEIMLEPFWLNIFSVQPVKNYIIIIYYVCYIYICIYIMYTYICIIYLIFIYIYCIYNIYIIYILYIYIYICTLFGYYIFYWADGITSSMLECPVESETRGWPCASVSEQKGQRSRFRRTSVSWKINKTRFMKILMFDFYTFSF